MAAIILEKDVRRRPKSYGLLKAVPPEPMPDHVGVYGHTYWDESCAKPTGHPVGCVPASENATKPVQDPPLFPDSCEFTIVGGATCETVGDLGADEMQDAGMRQRAVGVIENGGSCAVEQIVSLGGQWVPGEGEEPGTVVPVTGSGDLIRWCCPEDELADKFKILCDGESLSMCDAISALENEAADCSPFETLIHLPVATNAYFDTGFWVPSPDGDWVQLPLTGQAATFGNYSGVHPVTGEPADEGSTWLVMTDWPCILATAPLAADNGDEFSVLDRPNNMRTWFVEQDFSVSFGGCCFVAVQAKLCK